MYDKLNRELYPDHKVQAIAEFTSARLQSYYTSSQLTCWSIFGLVNALGKLRMNALIRTPGCKLPEWV